MFSNNLSKQNDPREKEMQQPVISSAAQISIFQRLHFEKKIKTLTPIQVHDLKCFNNENCKHTQRKHDTQIY